MFLVMRTNFSNSVRLHGVSIFCIASIIKQVSWENTTFSYEEYIQRPKEKAKCILLRQEEKAHNEDAAGCE